MLEMDSRLRWERIFERKPDSVKWKIREFDDNEHTNDRRQNLRINKLPQGSECMVIQ